MKLKQSYNQYRNIKGKHYQFWTANGGADGFAEQKEEEYLILREIKS